MGECADDMINGGACQICGCFFMDDDEPGHPRTCNDCGGKGGDTL